MCILYIHIYTHTCKRKVILSPTQLGTLKASGLSARYTHWYNSGTSVIGKTSHFLLNLSLVP